MFVGGFGGGAAGGRGLRGCPVAQHQDSSVRVLGLVYGCVNMPPACCCCRYLVIYVTEGCRPQNRLYYLDLQQVPRDTQSGALDFSKYDFFKGAWVDGRLRHQPFRLLTHETAHTGLGGSGFRHKS